MLRFAKKLSTITILLAVLLASISINPVHAQTSIDTIIDAAMRDLSTRLGVTVSRTTLDTTDSFSWTQNKYPDASLGCPIPGQDYPKNPMSGYSIDISFKGSVYNYRATVDGATLILCTPAGPAQSGATFDLAQPQSSGLSVNTLNYSVVLKVNPTKTSATDVFLVDPITKQESLLITLDEVYREQYHPAEYHNGNLYVIHRRGDPQTNPNWMDELWIYPQNKQGRKLFSNRGLDFRAAEDGTVAIIGSVNNQTGGAITFIDPKGATLSTFSSTQLGVDAFAPLAWGISSFWVRNAVAASPIQTMVKFIRTGTTFQPSAFTVPNIPISDYAFNPYAEVIAYSDFPVMFSEGEAKSFTQSGRTVTLFAYDLNAKASQQIATSIAKKFNPQWLNPITLGYDDPQSANRSVVSLASVKKNSAIGQAICSPSNATEAITITVVNNTQQAIALNWVDSNCVETPYQVIPAGASVQQATFSGHIWVVSTSNNQMIKLVVVQQGNINIP